MLHCGILEWNSLRTSLFWVINPWISIETHNEMLHRTKWTRNEKFPLPIETKFVTRLTRASRSTLLLLQCFPERGNVSCDVSQGTKHHDGESIEMHAATQINARICQQSKKSSWRAFLHENLKTRKRPFDRGRELAISQSHCCSQTPQKHSSLIQILKRLTRMKAIKSGILISSKKKRLRPRGVDHFGFQKAWKHWQICRANTIRRSGTAVAD